MSDWSSIPVWLGLVVLGAPFVMLALLGLPSLAEQTPSEPTTSRMIAVLIVVGLLASISQLAGMLLVGSRHVTIDLGQLVHLPDYHFSLKFVFDRLSVPFVILTYLLCGTISAFAARYLHREPGFHRFHVLFALFVAGMVVASLADTIETLFAGWEMVGISSALLVAFFQDRPAPVRNGLRVWSVYRVSDAALLLAAVYLHHLRGGGDFDALLGATPWPEGQTIVSSQQALLAGLLLLVAAAGKSALIPFSGWLPRAMEGPTPSSAVFYGALSVHLGAFLLLRISPLLDSSWALSLVVAALGLSTALLATLARRVQSDIKSDLSFASLTQVGLIVAEIGCGFRYLALMHIMGHACLRTLQLLRAPSVLQDSRRIEDAIGRRLTPSSQGPFRWLSDRWARRAYAFALDRGYLDAWLEHYLVRPLLAMFSSFDRWERRWNDALAGRSDRAARDSGRTSPALEELA